MITSTNNQQMKQVSLLLKKSKERKSTKTFVVEGPRMVVEAPVASLKAVYVAEGYENNPENHAVLAELKTKCDKANAIYEVVADNVFKVYRIHRHHKELWRWWLCQSIRWNSFWLEIKHIFCY